LITFFYTQVNFCYKIYFLDGFEFLLCSPELLSKKKKRIENLYVEVIFIINLLHSQTSNFRFDHSIYNTVDPIKSKSVWTAKFGWYEKTKKKKQLIFFQVNLNVSTHFFTLSKVNYNGQTFQSSIIDKDSNLKRRTLALKLTGTNITTNRATLSFLRFTRPVTTAENFDNWAMLVVNYLLKIHHLFSLKNNNNV